MKNKLKVIFTLILTFILGFVIWFVWAIYSDKPPQFFPFNEVSGEYVIIKKPGTEVFVVNYKGPNALDVLTVGSEGFISIMVGRTHYDLNQYIGKKVILTNGSFQNGFSEQCIANKCVAIGGPYAAVVIDEMEERR